MTTSCLTPENNVFDAGDSNGLSTRKSKLEERKSREKPVVILGEFH